MSVIQNNRVSTVEGGLNMEIHSGHSELSDVGISVKRGSTVIKVVFGLILTMDVPSAVNAQAATGL